jgi:hypothetical protein
VLAQGATAAQLLGEVVNRERSLRRCGVELAGSVADVVGTAIAEADDLHFSR